ncbi:MAG TPA: hypothetical protein VI431_00805 [Candidatus Acidoferrum sp.]
MWILRGTLYGILAFVIFGLLFYIKKFSIRTNAAVSLRTLEYLTIHNLWFWAVFVLMICTGIAYARWMAEIP